MYETQIKCECDFCGELNGEENLYFELAKEYDLPLKRIVYQGEYWVVFPTIGTIVPGYLLIVSKKHRSSIRNCNELEILELQKIIKYIRNLLEDIYRYPCIAFEHGSGCGQGMSSACVEHCHLHILPLKEDLRAKFHLVKMQIIPMKSLTALSQMIDCKDSYLLYQDHDGNYYILQSDVYISQYFRQLIAMSEGKAEQWNWRQHHFVDYFKQTLEDITVAMHDKCQ